MSVEVIYGDALALPVADNSVDLVVTSPPYFGQRLYQDEGVEYAGQIGAEPTPAEFVDALVAATREMSRALKPSGSIFVNLGDKYAGGGGGNYGADAKRNSKGGGANPTNVYNRRAWLEAAGMRAKSLMNIPARYAIRCTDDLGLIQRAELIWFKPNSMPESSAKDRVSTAHEVWLHFVKTPKYHANMDPIREVDEAGTPGRPARSVWSVPTEGVRLPTHLGAKHYAAFPMEWPRRLITAFCPEGGVVLDPFGGTGTTATVAHALGRHGITVDLSHDYCRVAQWRTSDEKQLAKARGDK